MNGEQRFEGLIAWQKARALTRRVYEISRSGEFGRDYRLGGQIQAASVSIMSNIAEGFDRHNPAEFHQFIKVAKASCAELRSQLYVAFDVGYIDERVFSELQEQAEEVC